VAALVRKGSGQVKAWYHVNARPGFGLFKEGLVKTLALRVLHGTGDLALPATDAPLRIDKDCFHMGYLLR
jgi:hypothetical protein